MNSTPSHQPFISVFRPDFEVVTERRGKRTLYPHTQQLALLQRALTLEFRNALPSHLSKVDRRGNAFQKYLLHRAAGLFCNLVHAARPDGLLVYALCDADLVAHIAIVQQVTEETREGRMHRFNFFAGESFQPEVRISGWKVAFTDHVLERFRSRVRNNVGEHLSVFLLMFYSSLLIGLPAGGSMSFIVPYYDTLLAFPFGRLKDEVILMTCLTVDEINSLERVTPCLTFNQHYGQSYELPRIRHWLPTKTMMQLYSKWERKVALPTPPQKLSPDITWHWMAQRIRDIEVANGFGPGMTFAFLDRIPGPYTVYYAANMPEPRVDERKTHQQLNPNVKWNRIFDQRDHFVRTLTILED